MEGSTPSPLSPLATAAPLGKEQTGPPELPIPPCHPWSPQHSTSRGEHRRAAPGRPWHGHRWKNCLGPAASSGFRGMPWLIVKLFSVSLNI